MVAALTILLSFLTRYTKVVRSNYAVKLIVGYVRLSLRHAARRSPTPRQNQRRTQKGMIISNMVIKQLKHRMRLIAVVDMRRTTVR